jgi:hypothetical protein
MNLYKILFIVWAIIYVVIPKAIIYECLWKASKACEVSNEISEDEGTEVKEEETKEDKNEEESGHEHKHMVSALSFFSKRYFLINSENLHHFRYKLISNYTELTTPPPENS